MLNQTDIQHTPAEGKKPFILRIVIAVLAGVAVMAVLWWLRALIIRGLTVLGVIGVIAGAICGGYSFYRSRQKEGSGEEWGRRAKTGGTGAAACMALVLSLQIAGRFLLPEAALVQPERNPNLLPKPGMHAPEVLYHLQNPTDPGEIRNFAPVLNYWLCAFGLPEKEQARLAEQHPWIGTLTGTASWDTMTGTVQVTFNSNIVTETEVSGDRAKPVLEFLAKSKPWWHSDYIIDDLYWEARDHKVRIQTKAQGLESAACQMSYEDIEKLIQPDFWTPQVLRRINHKEGLFAYLQKKGIKIPVGSLSDMIDLKSALLFLNEREQLTVVTTMVEHRNGYAPEHLYCCLPGYFRDESIMKAILAELHVNRKNGRTFQETTQDGQTPLSLTLATEGYLGYMVELGQNLNDLKPEQWKKVKDYIRMYAIVKDRDIRDKIIRLMTSPSTDNYLLAIALYLKHGAKPGSEEYGSFLILLNPEQR